MTLKRLSWVVVIAAIGLWMLSPVAFKWLLSDWPTRGQAGDTFGAINALFSGLALGGVILAIFMQREELQLQREELAATREELRRTAQAQEAAATAMRQQAEILLTTAKLTAMSTLVDYHGQRTAHTSVNAAVGYARRIAEQLDALDGDQRVDAPTA